MTSSDHPTTSLGEFVALMATLTALVSLSIDMVLPALPAIGSALGVERANDNQLVISLLFLGFGLGQLFYGPLSDAAGRKPAAYAGLALFTAGCLLALLARTFPMMLAGTVSPRRRRRRAAHDYARAGKRQVRRPGDGAGHVAHHGRFHPRPGRCTGHRASDHRRLGMEDDLRRLSGDGVVAFVWFGVRQEETLPSNRRIPFSPGRMASCHARRRDQSTVHWLYGRLGIRVWRLSRVPDVCPADPSGAVRAWARGFRCTSRCSRSRSAAASLLNASLVVRYGMRALSTWSLRGICLASVAFTAVASAAAGHPPLWMLMTYLMVSFFGIGLLFGNLNALAMQPLGRIAGTGAAVVGATSMLISLALGTLIGQSYNGTVLPLVVGFAVLSACSLISAWWAEMGTPADQAASVADTDIETTTGGIG